MKQSEKYFSRRKEFLPSSQENKLEIKCGGFY
jgi:hypothetical protein